MDRNYASPREGFSNYGLNPRIAKTVTTVKENFQATEAK